MPKASEWIAVAGSAFAALAGSAAIAHAQCYEVVGCVNETVFPESFLMKEASCDVLWEIRNGIYHRAGYCFSSERGISTYGNKGCTTDDQDAVPLNNYERENIALIKKVEAARGCE